MVGRDDGWEGRRKRCDDAVTEGHRRQGVPTLMEQPKVTIQSDPPESEDNLQIVHKRQLPEQEWPAVRELIGGGLVLGRCAPSDCGDVSV